MATLNRASKNLAADYLFSEIAARVKKFKEEHPKADIIRLGIGNTTEPLTMHIGRGIRRGVAKLRSRKTYTGYGDEQGEKDLREGLTKFYHDTRNVSIEPEEIFINDGAKPDLGNIQSLFGLDNVVAVQDPVYPAYVDTSVFSGRGRAFNSQTRKYEGIVYLPCTPENDFFPKLPSEKVDIIYFCSPNNPTGAVATRRQLEQLVSYAQEQQAVIIYDAAYADYIQDLTLPKSIYQIPGAENCAIEINSFSKNAGFTGLRLGWTIIPYKLKIENTAEGEVHDTWLARQRRFFNGASNVVQHGGLAALSERGRAEMIGLVSYYMGNAQILRNALTSNTFRLQVYGGTNAPYLWVKTPQEKPNSWGFFNYMLNKTEIVCTPGAGFGPNGEGYIRFSAFGHRRDMLRAAQRIEKKLFSLI